MSARNRRSSASARTATACCSTTPAAISRNRRARGVAPNSSVEYFVSKNQPSFRSLCVCGCGKRCQSRSGYARGHRPIKRYRQKNYKPLHRLRAEAALGKPLPLGAEVHHVDGSKGDTAPLVICQDGAYHQLLHYRMRVLRAGGNPDADGICRCCRNIFPLLSFRARKKEKGRIYLCRSCCAIKSRLRRAQLAERAMLATQGTA